ncbi:FecCD family ABC transporter permease [Faecalispora jeddahensis]|uniref:FecCD family ABC transporter permease n=1 Tax=Faecalispora jeddahensis TaxID=1414721 RepID=UPI0018988351|nr:iron ABC transporter permease [Faecalispora jeddahensis]
MGSSRRSTLAIFACAVSLLLAALLALSLGAVRLSLTELFYGLKEIDSPAGRILLHVRVPRLLAAALAGAGLSVSGVLIQTVLQNPLASPGIIGVNAGAGLSVALCMALLPGVVLVLPFAAFLGALASVLLVYGIARRAGASRITLVLSGVALSSLMTAGINTLVTLFPDIMTGLRDFQNGGFEGVSTGILRPAGLVILFGLLVSLLFAGELDVLGLGEITASSLGLPVRFYRFLFLALAAALAGAAVSFAGLLGFVGLIVPHMARFLLKGSGKRSFLLLSALLGAAFLILCDTAARTAFAPFELPVGILVAYLGVPFFLWLLFRERRKRHD